MFDWSKKRLSHLLIQKGKQDGIIPEYVHSIDVLGQPSGAKRRNKIHQYHVDGENLRDVAEKYDNGEERCQTEIIDPIEHILAEKLGIITRVDFWPKNIMIAPETAQKITKALKKGIPFDLDSEDAIYVNIDPDHWHFKGEKVKKLLPLRDIPIFARLK
jgi:hypothetical protein